MATTITIRNLDEGTQKVLRHRAVDHGRSFEAEIRAILEHAARTDSETVSDEPALFAAARQLREELQAADIDFPVLERNVEQQREVFL